MSRKKGYDWNEFVTDVTRRLPGVTIRDPPPGPRRKKNPHITILYNGQSIGPSLPRTKPVSIGALDAVVDALCQRLGVTKEQLYQILAGVQDYKDIKQQQKKDEDDDDSGPAKNPMEQAIDAL